MEFFATESRTDHIPPVLDLTEHLADRKGFNGAQGDVDKIVALFQPVQESAVRQDVQGFLNKLDRQMALLRELPGRLRLLAGDKSSADRAHDVDVYGEPQCQTRAGRKIPRLVIAVRLDSEGQLRAAKHDRPADLQPGDEQRNGREGAVDRGIFRHPDLEGEIEPQYDVEGRAGGDAGYDAGQDLYLAVRHEKIEEDEAEPDQNVRHQSYQKMHGRRKASQKGQLLDDPVGLGFKKDRDGRGKYQKEGQKDYDGAVVDDLPAEGAALHAAENVVEGKLDIAKKLDDGPKQDQYADSRHGSEFGVL